MLGLLSPFHEERPLRMLKKLHRGMVGEGVQGPGKPDLLLLLNETVRV